MIHVVHVQEARSAPRGRQACARLAALPAASAAVLHAPATLCPHMPHTCSTNKVRIDSAVQ